MPVRLPEFSLSGKDLADLTTAVQILERLFPNCEIRIDKETTVFSRVFSSANETKRDKVIASISNHFLSVPEIAAATGLDSKQVRGVLNSQDIKFVRKKENGELRYFYEAPKSTAIPRESHGPLNRTL
jgi:hypothetical protein